MAKIAASEARDPLTHSPRSDYMELKNEFVSNFFKKINYYRLGSVIEDIFEMFKDPSHKKKRL